MVAVVEEELFARLDVARGVHADAGRHVADYDLGAEIAGAVLAGRRGVVYEAHLVADVVGVDFLVWWEWSEYIQEWNGQVRNIPDVRMNK